MVTVDSITCDTCGKEQACHKARIYGMPTGWVSENRRQFCSEECKRNFRVEDIDVSQPDAIDIVVATEPVKPKVRRKRKAKKQKQQR